MEDDQLKSIEQSFPGCLSSFVTFPKGGLCSSVLWVGKVK